MSQVKLVHDDSAYAQGALTGHGAPQWVGENIDGA